MELLLCTPKQFPKDLNLVRRQDYCDHKATKVPIYISTKNNKNKMFTHAYQSIRQRPVAYKKKFTVHLEAYNESGNTEMKAGDIAMDFCRGLDSARYVKFTAKFENDRNKGLNPPADNAMFQKPGCMLSRTPISSQMQGWRSWRRTTQEIMDIICGPITACFPLRRFNTKKEHLIGNNTSPTRDFIRVQREVLQTHSSVGQARGWRTKWRHY
jgi:hypothetical protein